MMTALRRILPMALIAALAGLGVITALLGQRPRRALSAGADTGSAHRRKPRPMLGALRDRNAIGSGLKGVSAKAEVLIPAAASSSIVRRPVGRGPVVALVGLLLLTGLGGIVYERRAALFETRSAMPAGDGQSLTALSPPAAGSAPLPITAVETTTGSVRTPSPGTPAGLPPAPRATSAVPDVEVVRVEPSGVAAMAERIAPNPAIEAPVDGKPVAQPDAKGPATLMPRLTTGSSGIGLRATDAPGATPRIAVQGAPSHDATPLVAPMTPDTPTVVVSPSEGEAAARPTPTVEVGRQALRTEDAATTRQDLPALRRNAPKPGADTARTSMQAWAKGETASDSLNPAREPPRAEAPAAGAAIPLKVMRVGAQGGGKLFATARGVPGADMRLHMTGTRIAPATVGRDGMVTFAVGRGVKTRDDPIRLDGIDSAIGKVRDRAGAPFTAPGPRHDNGLEYAAARQGLVRVSAGPDTAEPRNLKEAVPRGERPTDQAQPAMTGSLALNGPARASGASEIEVPGSGTVRIARGDSLWRISRRAYGAGERYTLIYAANRKRIRDPDLIYPGQIFVLPRERQGDAAANTPPR